MVCNARPVAIMLVRYTTATLEDKSLGLSGFTCCRVRGLEYLRLMEARWEWVSEGQDATTCRVWKSND
jgi:hypothetical protein